LPFKTERNAEEYAAKTKELLGIQHRTVKFIEVKKKMEAEKAKQEKNKMTSLFQSMNALNSYMRKSYDADKGNRTFSWGGLERMSQIV
jgi:hypothetical protein